MLAWDEFRRQLPVTAELTYLNHAAVAPLPRACREGVEAYLEELSRYGAARYPGRPHAAAERARQLGATLLGTTPQRVFFVTSTSQGLGVAATGLPCRPGDNVVLVAGEFPANLRPWLPLGRRGVEIRRVPQRDGRVLLDDLAAAVDRRTAALSVSFVQFLSGFRLDPAPVAELCRRHDALFVVDGIQGLGAFPLEVETAGIDLVAADAHKWLLGPEGVGLGYVSDRALARIEPALEGWLSVARPFDFFDLEQPLSPDAHRFEVGAPNMAGIHGLAGSLALLLEAGVARIATRILELTDQLVAGLGARGWTVRSPRAHAGEKSGIVLASRPGVDLEALRERLLDAGIVVSVRGDGLRVSPHAYNTPDEIAQLLAALPAS